MRPRLGATVVFADRDMSIIVMLDHAARNPVEADEAKSAEDAFRAEVFSKKLFVAKTVLKGEQHRLLVQKRRDEFEEIAIGRGLERDENEIARSREQVASWCGEAQLLVKPSVRSEPVSPLLLAIIICNMVCIF